MVSCRNVAVFFLVLLSVVGAVEIQVHVQSASNSAVASHTTALAHAMTSKLKKLHSKEATHLAGVKAAQAAEDDDDDDDDSDDDDEADAKIATSKVMTPEGTTALYKAAKEAKDEKDKEGAAEDAAAEAEKEKEADAKSQAEEVAEEKTAEKAKEKAERKAIAALAAAKRKQQKVDEELKFFKDDDAFDAKIAAETKIMTNETQSPALASFLGSFRSEMRKYAMPAYPKFLQGKLDAANTKVAELKAELQDKEHAPKAAKIEEDKAAKTKDDKSEKDDKKKKPVVVKAKREVESEAEADAKEVAQKAGETWAISFFANVALMAVVFAMASAQDVVVKNYTWFIIDQVVAIFLAVMYYNAFDSLLDFHGMGVHDAVVASILHAVTMLALVLGAAYLLRNTQGQALAIICGAGAHLVSFSSIHAAAGAQNSLVATSYTYSMCIFGICTLGLALLIIGYLVYTAKKRGGLTEGGAQANDDFMDKTDDLENDFGAMAFSVVFTMFVRFLLTGHHPVDDETDFDHTKEQRTTMFVWACVCLIIAGVVVTYCSKKAAARGATYATKRVMGFFSTVAAMNVAWAWLYWGEWEFFEALYPGEAIKGRVMFAITMSVLGGCGLIGLSKIGTSGGTVVRNEKKVALTALGLVIAWSWELCFDAAVEAMCEGVAHPVGWKVATTISLAAIVVPVYATYMKPITDMAEKAIGG